MKIASHYKKAVEEIGKYLSESPDDREHTRRVYRYVKELDQHPSEALRLAVMIHDLKKWDIESEKSRSGERGNAKIREKINRYSVFFGDELLKDLEYDPQVRRRVKDILLFGIDEFDETRKRRPDSDTQTLRDADKLDFLATKLPDKYAPHWGSILIENQMRNAYMEMSPKARKIARRFIYKDDRLGRIFKQVIEEVESSE